MSDRERWIVYPLLFLAIGASLRDKLFDRTTSKSIVCQELIVVGEALGGREPVRILARIGSAESSTPQAPREGQMFVDGQVLVEQLRAGSIVSDNYAYRGMPFAPTLRAILPGVSPADLLRALQRSAEAASADQEKSPPAETPAGQPDAEAETTPPPQ
jgi:hypothetical protein